jgi:lysophospholipase L1-like esterase
VVDLTARWQTDALDLKPDVLSLLIGINDATHPAKLVSANEYDKQYNALLTRTREQLPNVRFVLCEPFALPAGRLKDSWDATRRALAERQAIVRTLAEKHRAVLVGAQRVFDEAMTLAPAEYWMWDGIHPTYRGHQLLADAWLRAASERWVE